jgi:hypothetical protein
MDAVPILTSVAIHDRNLLTFQGQTAHIGLEVRRSGVFQTRTLMQVTEIPTMTLYHPDNSLAVDEAPMVEMTTGRYAYAYQTQHDDPLGLWTARLTARTLHGTARLDRVGVFLLVRSLFPFYTVFAIKDQTGVLWYWYIDMANTPTSVPYVPTATNRLPQILNIDEVPGWVKITSTEGETRYLYPDVAGQFTIDFIPPPIGPEWPESPLFTAQTGERFTLACDVLSQLITVPVV